MYSRHQLLLAFKRLASVEDSPSNKSHCQRLNYHAERLGFQTFEHYRRWLKSAPEKSLGKLSIGLMEHVCATKLPSLDEPYFEFTPMPEGFSYYTHWIGWDKCGNEVRVPRPLNAQDSVPQLRKLLDYPIYVIESVHELLAWQYRWKSTGYIPESIARDFFASFFKKDHLVDPNVSTELIRQRSAERQAKMDREIGTAEDD